MNVLAKIARAAAACAVAWLCAVPGAVHAQVAAAAPDLVAALREQIVMVPVPGKAFGPELETTVFRPPGEGPFPLVVISHGKAPGDPRFQARYRPLSAVRFFLARGYAVVVPMRAGFAKSSGSYIGGGCNVESNGRAQAEDVKAVLDWLGAQPWARRDEVLLVGQSHGGWTTLAAGSMGWPGVKGLVNFAGGLRQEGCVGWEGTLARAAGSYGQHTRVPSLWFYGENDSYFPVHLWKAMAEAYQAGGAPVQVIDVGRFGSDSHALFGARAGAPLWQPKVAAFMAALGLPQALLHPELERAGQTPAPPASGFAALDEVDKVPHLKPAGREGYRAFLVKALPRAFAIAPNGAWGWADGGDDPLARALANCARNAVGECRLYAVDDQVVWKESP